LRARASVPRHIIGLRFQHRLLVGPTQTARRRILLLTADHFRKMAAPKAIQPSREFPDRIHVRAYGADPRRPCASRRGPICDIGLRERCSCQKSKATRQEFKNTSPPWMAIYYRVLSVLFMKDFDRHCATAIRDNPIGTSLVCPGCDRGTDCTAGTYALRHSIDRRHTRPKVKPKPRQKASTRAVQKIRSATPVSPACSPQANPGASYRT